MPLATRVPTLVLAVLALTAIADPAKAREKPKEPAAEVKRITIEEFDKMRAAPGAVVLDVRTPEEFAAGHVPGAVNLPIADEMFDEKLKSLARDKTYLVHCAKGVRSERATKKMRGLVTSLFEYKGGFEEWKRAGKPVEKGEAAGEKK